MGVDVGQRRDPSAGVAQQLGNHSRQGADDHGAEARSCAMPTVSSTPPLAIGCTLKASRRCPAAVTAARSSPAARRTSAAARDRVARRPPRACARALWPRPSARPASPARLRPRPRPRRHAPPRFEQLQAITVQQRGNGGGLEPATAAGQGRHQDRRGLIGPGVVELDHDTQRPSPPAAVAAGMRERPGGVLGECEARDAAPRPSPATAGGASLPMYTDANVSCGAASAAASTSRATSLAEQAGAGTKIVSIASTAPASASASIARP